MPIPNPQWSLSGGGGFIANGEACLVGAATVGGPYTLTCRDMDSGIAGTAQITVTPHPLATITITPPSATLSPGEQSVFTAASKDASGNTVSIPDPMWSTSGGGMITPNHSSCTYTATTPGTYTITCSENGTAIQGTSTIDVNFPAQLTTIENSPANVILNVGQPQQFTATGKDQHGNPATITNPVWTTTGGGTLAPNGTTCKYTATQGGNYTITCRENGTAIQGSATIRTTSNPPPKLSILPQIVRSSGATYHIQASIIFQGIGKQDIANVLPEIYDLNDPNQVAIQAKKIFIFSSSTKVKVIGLFDKNELLAVVKSSGTVTLEMVDMLASGDSYVGRGTVYIAK